MEPFIFHVPHGLVHADDGCVDPFAPLETQYCYGVFHEPQGHFMAGHAVLFVYPWGQDYVRSHRALRKMAMNLAQQGIPSIRFDYRCTGDSGGDHLDISMQSMIEDIQAAYDQLQDKTGADYIQVVGVRLGALACLKALGTVASEIHCWDPVLFGDEYVQELYGPTITTRVFDSGNAWINGYPLTTMFEQNIRTTCIEPHDLQCQVYLYGVEKSRRQQLWCEACYVDGRSIQVLHQVKFGEGSIWGNVNTIGGFVNPRPLLQTLEDHLIKRVAL